MKHVTLREISSKNTAEVIDDLRQQRYSVLESAGCGKLRAEMKPVGKICSIVVKGAWLLAGGNDSFACYQKTRKLLGHFLRMAAPGDIAGLMNDDSKHECVVYGFNHPSLGEIIRFINHHLLHELNRTALFPVNLPWFECLMPVADILEGMGIILVPIVTPSTKEKMFKKMLKTEQNYLNEISAMFTAHYTKCLREMACQERCTFYVAPSATRQAKVFTSEAQYLGKEKVEPQTMTLLAYSLERAKAPDYVFIPVAVAPPKKAGRGLNLFRKYKLRAGSRYSKANITRLLNDKSPYYRGRTLENTFLSSIASTLMNMDRMDLIS